ncbi:hypothetical protein L6Q96_13165 [Candidatus Binatia bacterium]|nr:hypothetical protein [Candidatus Binatia bacterium]
MEVWSPNKAAIAPAVAAPREPEKTATHAARQSTGQMIVYMPAQGT